MSKKYNYTKKTGRPTTYDPLFIEKANEYLDQCSDEEVQELTGLSAKGTELYRNKLKVKLPTLEGFAIFLDVDRTSLNEWEKRHPEFSHALNKIKAEQQKRLLDNGLSGDYNSTIAKLILSSNHGMREKTDVTTDDQPIVNGVEINIRK